jgi:hypothetical protein
MDALFPAQLARLTKDWQAIEEILSRAGVTLYGQKHGRLKTLYGAFKTYKEMQV